MEGWKIEKSKGNYKNSSENFWNKFFFLIFQVFYTDKSFWKNFKNQSGYQKKIFLKILNKTFFGFFRSKKIF